MSTKKESMIKLFNKRLKPSFLIIGGVKCGTSSLYRYLNAHPNVLPCQTKEPQYFSSKNPIRLLVGLNKYFSLFPLKDHYGELEADWLDLVAGKELVSSKIVKHKKQGQQYITGEASANTFFRANPAFVKTILPNVKLIMLTRHPSTRFYSHYQMFQRFQEEGKKGFDLAPLDRFVEQEIEAYHTGRKTKIIHQGLYVKYLKQWENKFGRNQLKVIPTADLKELDSAKLRMKELCTFLNLAPYDFKSALAKKHNQAKTSSMPLEIKKKLDAFYADSIKELEVHYGIKFNAV